jgi:steroid delta-isomerase-like uncharacterized protein
MTLDANKALVRRLYEAMNQRTFDVFDEVLAPDYVHRSSPEYQFDRQQLKESTINFGLAAFPDLHVTIDELIAEGDTVMARWTQRGTHRGPFLDMPPTGKQVSYSGINIFRIANGQIVEDTPYWDFNAVIQQLNAPSDEAQP